MDADPGRGARGGGAAAVVAAAAAPRAARSPASAGAAVAHTVIEGETLSGIAAANGISTESLAAYNGISAETLVIAGPDAPGAERGRGRHDRRRRRPRTSTAAPGYAPATVPASWTTAIYSPIGAAYLASNAAAAWESLRQAGLATFGIDIYPAGPLSAYRTYEQQAYLYDLYLAGRRRARRTRPGARRTSTGPRSTSRAPRCGR